MANERTFTVGEEKYVIPEDKVGAFLNVHKDAKEITVGGNGSGTAQPKKENFTTFSRDGVTYNIPDSKKEAFLSRFPYAKEVKKKDEPLQTGSEAYSPPPTFEDAFNKYLASIAPRPSTVKNESSLGDNDVVADTGNVVTKNPTVTTGPEFPALDLRETSLSKEPFKEVVYFPGRTDSEVVIVNPETESIYSMNGYELMKHEGNTKLYDELVRRNNRKEWIKALENGKSEEIASKVLEARTKRDAQLGKYVSSSLSSAVGAGPLGMKAAEMFTSPTEYAKRPASLDQAMSDVAIDLMGAISEKKAAEFYNKPQFKERIKDIENVVIGEAAEIKDETERTAFINKRFDELLNQSGITKSFEKYVNDETIKDYNRYMLAVNSEWMRQASSKSSSEFIARGGLFGSLTGSLTSMVYGIDQPPDKYPANWLEKGMAGALGILADGPIFKLAGVPGKYVAELTLNQIKKSFITKFVAMGATEQLATRLAEKAMINGSKGVLSKPIVQKMIGGGIQSAAMLGGYDAMNDIVAQADAIRKNPELSLTDFDVVSTMMAAGHGTIIGLGLGVLAPSTSTLTARINQQVTNPYLKAGVRTGVGATGFGVENAWFVYGGALMNGNISDVSAADLMESAAMLGVLKGRGMLHEFKGLSNDKKIAEFKKQFKLTQGEIAALERFDYLKPEDKQKYDIDRVRPLSGYGLHELVTNPDIPETVKRKLLTFYNNWTPTHDIPVENVTVRSEGNKYYVDLRDKNGNLLLTRQTDDYDAAVEHAENYSDKAKINKYIAKYHALPESLRGMIDIVMRDELRENGYKDLVYILEAAKRNRFPSEQRIVDSFFANIDQSIESVKQIREDEIKREEDAVKKAEKEKEDKKQLKKDVAEQEVNAKEKLKYTNRDNLAGIRSDINALIKTQNDLINNDIIDNGSVSSKTLAKLGEIDGQIDELKAEERDIIKSVEKEVKEATKEIDDKIASVIDKIEKADKKLDSESGVEMMKASEEIDKLWPQYEELSERRKMIAKTVLDDVLNRGYSENNKKGGQDAVQKPEAESVLQPKPKETGKPGGGRGGVEPKEQGEEAASEGKEEKEEVGGKKETRFGKVGDLLEKKVSDFDNFYSDEKDKLSEKTDPIKVRIAFLKEQLDKIKKTGTKQEKDYIKSQITKNEKELSDIENEFDNEWDSFLDEMMDEVDRKIEKEIPGINEVDRTDIRDEIFISISERPGTEVFWKEGVNDVIKKIILNNKKQIAEREKDDKEKPKQAEDEYANYLLDELEKKFKERFPKDVFERDALKENWVKNKEERGVFKANDLLEDVLLSYYKPEDRAGAVSTIRDEFKNQKPKENVKEETKEKGEGLQVTPEGETAPKEGQKPPVKPVIPTSETKSERFVEKPLSEINIDTKRFQNRTELDKNQLKYIKENWNRNELDPVVIWKDADGKDYLLAGHHRLEAARELGEKTIPARYFEGSEQDAINYAIEKSNANRTMEQPYDRAKIYRKMRDQGKSKSDIKKALEQEGKNKSYIENLSYLNPNGKAIDMLISLRNAGDRVTVRKTEQIADWVGEARSFFPELTNSHENELYDWLMNGAVDKIRTKSEFIDRLQRIYMDIKANPDKPLNMENRQTFGTLETEKNREINDVKNQIKALEKERDSKTNPPSTQRLNEITKEIQFLNKKLGDLNKELIDAREGDKKQTSLFDDINTAVNNGEITNETVTGIEGKTTTEAGQLEPVITAIEGKAESNDKTKLNEVITEIDGILQGLDQDGRKPERTPAEHRQYIHDAFRREFGGKGVKDEEITAALALMDARAKKWSAEGPNRRPEDWYQRIEDVKGGDFKEGSTRVMQMPDGSKKVVRTIAPEIVNGFYYPIEKTVIELKSEKWGSGKQALAEMKSKGLKEDEVKWTGIEDWLSKQGKVTKQEILDYLKDNRVELVEVVQSDTEVEKKYYELKDAAGLRAISKGNANAAYQADGNRIRFQEISGEKPRGAVETLENGRKVIHAMHAPDFSTLVHEIAHVFEGDLGIDERKVIEGWAGTEGWTTKTSETFARGLERYVRDGEAPTEELKTIFQKAKEWMRTIYQNLIGSPIEKDITPEVKKILDGLFAEQKKEAEPIIPETTPKESPAGEYKYNLIYRPFGIGTYPNENFVRWEDNGTNFGVVVYSKPLEPERQKSFDLEPITEIDAFNGKQVGYYEDGYKANVEVLLNKDGIKFVMVRSLDKEGNQVDKERMTASEFLGRLKKGEYWELGKEQNPIEPIIPTKESKPEIKVGEKIAFARNDEKIKELEDDITKLLGDLGKPNFTSGPDMTKLEPFVNLIGKVVQLGYYKIEDIGKFLIEKGYNDWLPYLKDAYRAFKDNYDLSIEVKNSLSNGKDIEGFDPTRLTVQKPSEGVEGARNVVGGSADSGATGKQSRIRPPIRIADEGSLPTPSKEHIVDGRYDIDENQRYAANLAVERYRVARGRAFLLADGAGVGKTREILAIADEMSKDGKVLIVSLSSVIQDSFVRDAKAMGIDLKKFEIGTYDDLRNGKIGKGDYVLTVYDESQNLKNQLSAKAQAAGKVSTKHNLYVSATPMDKPEHAVYFLSEITDLPQKQIEKELGVTIDWITIGETSYARVRMPQGIKHYIGKILEFRKEAVKNGAMIRREYPFFGEIEDDVNRNLPGDHSKEVNMVTDIHDQRIDNATSIVVARMIKEAMGGKFNGLDLSSYVGKPEKEIFLKLKAEYENGNKGGNQGRNYWAIHKAVQDFKYRERTAKLSNIDKLNESNKIGQVYKNVKEALSQGKQVIVVGTFVNDVNIKAGSQGSKYGFFEKKIPAEETMLHRIEELLRKDGVKVAKIYGGNKDKSYTKEQDRFQNKEVQVLLMTAKSGGTGINLDDIKGDSPREMIVATAEYSGDAMEQLIGRVSRRNTKSPAHITMLYFNPNPSDQNRKKRADEKRRVIRAIVAGTEDLDEVRVKQKAEDTIGDTEDGGEGIPEGETTGPKGPAEPKNPYIEEVGNGIVVKNSFPIKDALKNAGGKFVKPLGGWLFNKTQKDRVQSIIDDYLRPDESVSEQGYSPKSGQQQSMAAKQGKSNLRDMELELEDVGVESEKPVKVTDILKEAEKRFNLPIRTGRMRRSRDVAGIYKPFWRVVRRKQYQMLDITAHEIAHDIDRRFSISKSHELTQEMMVELAKLDYDPTKGRLSEGYAEFMRHYISSPEGTAAAEAPMFYDWFENAWKRKNPIEAKNIDWLKDQVTKWRMQGAKKRALAMIDMERRVPFRKVRDLRKEEKRIELKEKSVTHWKDKLHTIDYVFGEMMAEAGVDYVRPSEHPYQIASALAKTGSAMTRRFVLGGTFDDMLLKTGKSLRDILQPFEGSKQKLTDAIVYAWAMRAIDLHNRVDSKGNRTPIKTGMGYDEAIYLVNKLHNDVNAKFARELTSFMSRVMDYLVDAGGLTIEAKERIVELNPSYIMLKRVMENSKGFGGVKQGKIFNQGNPIKGIRNSERDIQMPIKAMIREVESIINAAHSIRVARAFVDFAKKNSGKGNVGLGKWIERVPGDVEKIQIKLDSIKKQLLEANADLTNADLNSVIDVWVNGTNYFRMGKDNVVWVPNPVTGKKEFYKIHPLLYDAITSGMRPATVNWFVKYLLAEPAKLIRLGATAFKPSFALVTNPLRDIPTGGLQSQFKGGGRIDKQLFAIWGELLGQGKYIDEFRRSGVEMSNFLGQDINKMSGLLNEAMLKRKIDKGIFHSTPMGAITEIWKIAAQQTKYSAAHLGKTVREALSVTESGVRYAEFEAAMKSFEGRIEAARLNGDVVEYQKLLKDRAIAATNAANEVTLNFKKAGKYGEVMNMIVPFFNPRLQGTFKMYDMLTKKSDLNTNRKMDSRLRYMIKVFNGVTLPSLVLWWMNKDDPEYQELAPWRKYLCWNFKIGGHWVTLPRPPETGLIFGAIPEAILNSVYTKNPDAINDAMIQVLYNTLPDVVPGAVIPTAEVYFNWDTFRMKEIVNETVIDQDITNQVYPYTSNAAKRLSEILYYLPTGKHLNPIQIDHLLSGYTGGLSNDIISFSEIFKKNKTKAPELANTFIAGKLFIRENEFGFGSQSVKELYLNMKKAQASTKKINWVLKNENKEDIELTEAKVDSVLQTISENVEKYGKWDYDKLPVVEIDSIRKNHNLTKQINQEGINLYLLRSYIYQGAEYVKELSDLQRQVMKDEKIPKALKIRANEELNYAARVIAERINELVDELNKQSKNVNKKTIPSK